MAFHKPVHIERAKGGGNRQRIWTHLRGNREREFTLYGLAATLDIELATCRTYINALHKADFVELVRKDCLLGCATRYTYRFARDNGVHAPRLTNQGHALTRGRGNEAMWGTVRRTSGDWDIRELATLASTDAHRVSVKNAECYVAALFKAGFLVQTAPPKYSRGASPARYRVAPKHIGKPLPPMVQNSGALYDPNSGHVVRAEEVDPD